MIAAAIDPETLILLRDLYGTADRGYLPIWTPLSVGKSETAWVPVDDSEAVAETIARLDDAGRNVYLGLGLHAVPLGPKKRGTADAVIGIPGFCVDLDVAGPAHKHANLPPTAEAAIGLLDAFTLRPTVVIDSGHGRYAWWLLGEVLYFDDDAERAEAASVSRRIQRVIRAAAASRGWRVDATHSLAHVFRPAGATNRKPGLAPAPVRIESHDGRRYAVEEIEAYLPDDEDEPTPSPNGRERDASSRADVGRVLDRCAFMAHCRDDATTLSEPQWHGMLTVVARCRDGERWAHELSRPYASYSREETQRKYEHARDADKPLRCATIRRDLGGEPYCGGCPEWGKIKGPIVLGFPRVTLNGASPNGRHDAAGKDEGDDPPAPASGNSQFSTEPFALTDLGNAQRLVARHGADLRYCHAWSKWLVWDGTRWRLDDTGEIDRRAKQTVRAVYAEAADAPDLDARQAIARHAVRSEHEARIEAMIALAESEPEVPVRPDDLDRDPWLLACRNGVIDLRTGNLFPAERSDLITKLAPVDYDPDAACPTFLRFLDRIMAGNAELIEFLRRALGYSLTGLTNERILLILYGEGRNGKSTFLEVARAVLGDYARSTPTETLLARRDGGGIPNDVAALKGVRFATASEANENRRLDEAKVKLLTGGDTISARFLHREWFEFRPQFTIWLATNFKPIIRGQDRAIWDRVRLVPFAVRIPDDEQDRHLRDRLVAEAPGVLAWAVGGCLAWQADGLPEPPEVQAATQGYRFDMDTFGRFLADCCVCHPDARCTASALYAVYRRWCDENGEHHLSQTAFGRSLTDRGFTKGQEPSGDRARFWDGIGLPAHEMGGDQWAS